MRRGDRKNGGWCLDEDAMMQTKNEAFLSLVLIPHVSVESYFIIYTGLLSGVLFCGDFSTDKHEADVGVDRFARRATFVECAGSRK